MFLPIKEDKKMAKNVNHAVLAGAVKNVWVSERNGRDFMNLSVAVKDPVRDYNSRIPVTVSGPLATRLKDKVKEGSLICIEGRFEPYNKDKKTYYTVNTDSLNLMDAGSMNHIVLQCRLTHDPEMRTTENSQVINVGAAVSRSYADKTGEWREVTSFVNLVAWGDMAPLLGKYRSGTLIWVTGHLSSRKWTDKDGKDHYPVEVVVESVSNGGSGKYNQVDTTQDDKKADSSEDIEGIEDDGFMNIPDELDEELPFA